MISINAKIDLAIATGKWSNEPDDYVWATLFEGLRVRVEPFQINSIIGNQTTWLPDGWETPPQFIVFASAYASMADAIVLMQARGARFLIRLNDDNDIHYIAFLMEVGNGHLKFGMRQFLDDSVIF